jgi:hypothetical protein
MQLAVDSESLLASLALSPPHTAVHAAFFPEADAATQAAAAAATAANDTAAQEGVQNAPTSGTKQQHVRSAGASQAYHAHVLHQIAVAATPRRARARATFPRNEQNTTSSTSSNASSHDSSNGSNSSSFAAPATGYLSPSADALEFHMDESDLQFDSLDSARSSGGGDVSSSSLPLAKMNPANRLSSPADMIAQVAKEVRDDHDHDNADSAAALSRKSSLERRTSGDRQQLLQVPSAVTTTSTHALPHLSTDESPGSPNYLMSPASIADFRAHMAST